MKNLIKKSVSLLLVLLIVFSSAGTSLTGFYAFAADSTVYTNNGIKFTLNDANEATIVSYTPSSSNVEIPETVKKTALATKKYTVTAIGDHAIPSDARSVTIPSTVSSIGKDNFAGNHSLQTVTFVNSPITSIDDSMFRNCAQLTSITLPANLQYIGEQAFSDCYMLNNINIPSSVKTIGTAAFHNCHNLWSLTLNEGLVEIGYAAFMYCSALTNLRIPSTVRTIGTSAFSDCTALTELTLNEGLTEIGNSAFAHCYSLATVSIPSTVTHIGQGAFLDCRLLANIFIPEGNNLKYIYFDSFRDTAFYNNESNWMHEDLDIKALYLNNILLEIIGTVPEGKYEIRPHVQNVAIDFSNFITSSLSAFRVSSESQFFSTDSSGVLYNKSGTEVICFPRGLDSEFYYFDSNATSVRPLAFKENNSLKTVVFTNVKEIEKFAFLGCQSLKLVHIPSSVQKIGESAVPSVNNIQICSDGTSEILSNYASENGIALSICNGHSTEDFYSYLYYEIVNNEIHITGCSESVEGNLEIPEFIGDYPVVCIRSLSDTKTGNSNFNIRTVTIPKTVNNIYEDAFSLCFSIEKVTVDKDNPYYVSDEDGVLFNKDKNILVYFPSCPNENIRYIYSVPSTVKIIGGYAFCNSGIQEVYLPETVEVIGVKAFYGCDQLTTINFPYSLNFIEEDAFYECRRIQGCVTISQNVQFISESAFYNCENIEYYAVDELNVNYSNDESGILYNKNKTVLIRAPKISIDNEIITHSPESSFNQLENLRNFTVPDSVEIICNGAFSLCYGLESIKLPKSLKTLGENAFAECLRLEYIHIPMASKEFVVYDNFEGINPYLCSESENSFAKTLAEAYGLEFRTCNTHKSLYVKSVTSRQPNYYDRAYALYDITIFGCPQQIKFIHQETGETWLLDRDYATMYDTLDKSCVINFCTYDENGHEADVGDEGIIYEDWRVCLDLPEGKYNVITLPINSPEMWESVEGSYEFEIIYGENPGIVFDANGGYFWLGDYSTQYGLNINEGDEITYPEAPYREGYIFAYWALDGDRFNEVVFDGVNKTLEAVWIEESTEKYTVLTYIMNTQGEYELFTSELFEASNGETVTYTPTPVEGFSVNEEKSILSGEFYSGSSLVLKVYIDRNIFTLYFANCDYQPVRYLAGSIVAEPLIPEQKGHNFLGWIDDNGNWIEFPFLMPANDVTLYAVWEPEKYDLTFDAGEGFFNDGTNVKHFSVPFGTDIVLPDEPTREGYKFNGWTPTVPEKMPDESLCFYADWEAETYEITFHSEEGYFTEYNQREITLYYKYGEKVDIPEVMVSDELDVYFLYWQDDQNYTFVEEYYMPARDVEAFAIWKQNTYEILFDANGGAFKDGEILKRYELVFEESVPDPGIPQKEGYSFEGWSPEPPEKMEKSSVTCTAQWKAETYTVTFNAIGGFFVNQGTDTISYDVPYGDPIPFPKESPTREGYSFNGWDTDYTIMPAKDLDIDAKWDANEYIIEWVISETETYKESYDFSEKIQIYRPEEKRGYTFVYWSEEPNGPQADIPEKMPAESLKYYAVYEPLTYILTYYAGDGFFSNGTNKKSFKYKYGTEIPEFDEKPNLEGYTFDGWTPTVPPKMPAENIDVYATWEANKYTVTWVLETDETGTITDSAIEEYEYKELIVPYPITKPNHTFKGWFDKDNYPCPETMPSYNLVLYPKWDNKYTVRYYLSEYNRAEGIVYYEIQLCASENIPLPDPEIPPEPSGYDFSGWKCVTKGAENVIIGSPMTDFDLEFVAVMMPVPYSINWYIITEDGNCIPYASDNYFAGNKIISPSLPNNEGFNYSPWHPEVPEYMPPYDLVFYTNETRNIYTVTFNANGGNFADGSTSVSWEVPFEGEIIPPTEPTRTGYIFAGWTPAVPANMPAANQDFYAVWEPITVTAVFDAKGGTFKNHPEGTIINDAKNLIFVSVEYGKEIIIPEPPVKENFSFGGWDPEVPDVMTITDPLYFSATWVDCYYTVETYTMNTEGDYVKTEKRYSATPDQEIDISEKLKDIEDGSGLYGEAAKSVCTGVVKADNSLVLKLYFGRNQYKLTFDAGEGTFIDGTHIKTEKFYHGSIMPEYVPSLTGYKFVKWAPQTTETVLGEEEYTAEWEPIEYTITWNFADERETLVDTYLFGEEISDIPQNSFASRGYNYVWFEPNLKISVPTHMPATNLEFIEILHVLEITNGACFNAGEGVFSDGTSERWVSGYYGEEIPLPENPVREGYTFLGWNDDAIDRFYEPGYPVGFFDEYCHTFNAEWEINSHTVTFYANGGIFPDGKESAEYVVEYNAPIPSPDEVYYPHYLHINWICVTEGYGHLKVGDPMPDCDIKFVSEREQKPDIFIVFDANGGEFPDGETSKSFSVPYGQPIPVPEDPVREGYLFSGWDHPVDIALSSEWFYAQWIPIPEPEESTYSIEIYRMDTEGNYGPTSTTIATGPVGETVSISPEPLTGFSIGEESVLSGVIEADGSLVLKVYYERNKYVLHAIVDGEEIYSKEYYYEALTEEPEAPTFKGYLFRGWFDAQGNFVEFPFPMPAEDVYVYAYSDNYEQFYPVLIHIIWMSEGEEFSRTVVHYGDVITGPDSTPYKTGYTFDEWICTTDSNISVGDRAPHYDLEFNAEFDPNPVTVIFYDGKTEVSRLETECDAPISPPENYDKTGYTLTWKDSDGNKLPAFVPCIDFAQDETEIILKYYTDYTAKSYNVNWVDYGTTVKTEKYDYNSVIKEYTISKTGYSLVWKDKKENIVTFNDKTPVMPAEDVTYYAEWSANTYDAVFNANGGVFTNCPEGTIINDERNIITVPSVYNQNIVAPQNPERVGYAFKGWEPSVGKMDVAGTKTFTAKWTKLYKLEINYITLDGKEVAPQYSEIHEEDFPYFIPHPYVEGYTCDSVYVQGVLTEDTVINIYYVANVHEIRFLIKTPDELLNGELHSYTYSYGDKIEMSVFPPSYNGYSFSGFEDENGNEIELPETMPDNDIFVYVCYYAKAYTLQIDYVFSDGRKAADSFVDTVAFGESYKYESPEVTGYKPNFQIVTGTMPAKSVKHRVTYTVDGYNIYIKYNDETVETLAFDYGEKIVLDFDIPDIEGYTYVGTSEYPQTMPANDITINLEYTKNNYKVDITYQYSDGTQAAKPVSAEIPYGEEYNFESPAISGFIPDIDAVSGKMGAENISVTVTYKEAASVTYDANGASGKPPVQADVASGSEITVQGPGDLYKIYSEDIDINARMPVDVVLLLDSSGSMMENDPRDIRLIAAKEYADTLTDVDRAAVIDFDDCVTLLTDFTGSKQTISSSINRIDSNGGTMISSGMFSAIKLFETAKNPAGTADKIIILLTDGQSSYDTSISLLARNKGITVFTIGLGDGVQENLLREIAETTGGQYFWIDDASDLPALFEIISQKTVTIRYEFAGWLASDENGELGVYEEGDKLEVNNNTVLTAIWIEPDEMYIAEWAFGSKCRKQIYNANEKPVYNGPESIVENGNLLTLLGWDTDGDGISDFDPYEEMPPITKRTTYYAVYKTEKEKITEIELSSRSLTLFVGETAELLKKFVPESADKSDIVWTSTDSSVASVDKNGMVTAKTPGSVVVRAENIDKSVSVTCRVTVIEPKIVSISINTLPQKLKYYLGDKLDSTGLTLKVVYSDGEAVIIKDGFTCSPTILNVSGKRNITVDYNGTNCYFEVEVFKHSYNLIYTVDGTEYAKYVIDEGDTVPVPVAPEKQGYVFAGWDNNVPQTMPAEDLTFTASWISADDTSYSIEMYYMDTLGQYNQIPYITVACKGTTDETVSAEFVIPEGFAVDETVSVLSGTVAADGSLVLKVYFKRNIYSLTTVVNGNAETTKYYFGSLLVAPAAPVMEGYSFVEWQNENGSTFDFSAITYMPAYDIKVTATFEINKYTVQYFVDSKEYASYEVEYGTEVPVPQNPVFLLANKVFKKWEPEVADVMPAENLVYNAVIHIHSYSETVTKNPTCTEKGEITETCSCGKTIKSKTNALGHNWSAWQTLQNATQYENGVTVRTCSRCGAYDYEKIPALNANFTVRPIKDQKFNSFGNRPSVEVYSLDGKKLNPFSNYKTEYRNNTQVGTASVFVTGRGDYRGQIRVDFNIVEQKANDFAITFPTVIYSDTVEGIDPVVKYEETVLIKDKDYTVEYVTNENGDVTSAIISGIGNYAGEQTVEIETVEKSASFTVTEIPDQDYTGYEITPEFNVYDGENVLRENTDYTVEYSDNINVGFGQIVIRGTGNYSGSVTLPFRINGMDASELDIPILPDAVHGEEDYYPDFDSCPITHNGKELVEGVDYECYVESADSVGTAEIVIIGKGNYSGKTVIYVNIGSPAISSAEIVLPSDTLGYYKKITLTVNTFPDYTSAKNIVWSTSDKRIAKIDENGTVKAVGRGNVTITATVTDEYGNSVSTSVEITCTMTFWQSIVAFFRRLFGID